MKRGKETKSLEMCKKYHIFHSTLVNLDPDLYQNNIRIHAAASQYKIDKDKEVAWRSTRGRHLPQVLSFLQKKGQIVNLIQEDNIRGKNSNL